MSTKGTLIAAMAAGFLTAGVVPMASAADKAAGPAASDKATCGGKEGTKAKTGGEKNACGGKEGAKEGGEKHACGGKDGCKGKEGEKHACGGKDGCKGKTGKKS